MAQNIKEKGSVEGRAVMKSDLRKELKYLFSPKADKAELVDVPEFNFVMVDGEGDPNTSADFEAAVQALYGAAYTVKFMLKKGDGTDFTVMPLEGLWWAENMDDFILNNKSSWQWTLMIMQPVFVTAEHIDEAVAQLAKKGKIVPETFRFGSYHEGLSAQIMHIGPYSEEQPTVEKLHRFISERGYLRAGKHHEIYLGDPRRSAPGKLKTIVRQPARLP